MNKRVQYFFVLSLAFIYLTASTGFGVHECLRDGSVDILILKSDSDCSDLHHHSCCVIPDCETQEHDDSCCKTDVVLLDTDYQLPEISSYIFSASGYNDSLFPHFSYSLKKNSEGNIFFLLKSLRDGPLMLKNGISLFTAISQWRL